MCMTVCVCVLLVLVLCMVIECVQISEMEFQEISGLPLTSKKFFSQPEIAKLAK